MCRRLIIASGELSTREDLGTRLSRVPGIQIIGEAEDMSQALELLSRFVPDLLIADMVLKTRTGVQLTREVVERHPGVNVLVVDEHEDLQHARQALEAGAQGYLLRDAPHAHFCDAIESAISGMKYVSHFIGEALADDDRIMRALTLREREVLDCLAKGYSSEQIASRLKISVRTVGSHRQSIRRKLDIEGATGLIRFAVERRRR